MDSPQISQHSAQSLRPLSLLLAATLAVSFATHTAHATEAVSNPQSLGVSPPASPLPSTDAPVFFLIPREQLSLTGLPETLLPPPLQLQTFAGSREQSAPSSSNCRNQTFTPTVGSVALTSLVGITAGVLSYGGWVILHEGSHAVAIEAFGGNVKEFNFVPERLDDGRIRFASVTWEDPQGRISPREDALVSLAPNITGLTLGSVGTTLWATGNLPENRLLRTAFATFQIGASINGGFVGVWSPSKYVDVHKATQSLRLNRREATLLRTGLTTLAAVNLIPAADSLWYGLTGHSVLDGRQSKRKADTSPALQLQLAPAITPTTVGIQGKF